MDLNNHIYPDALIEKDYNIHLIYDNVKFVNSLFELTVTKTNSLTYPPNCTTLMSMKPVTEAAKTETMKKVALGTSMLRVKIVFTESAWVSVKDKSDNVVYEKLARAGDEDYAEGSPPLKFHVGNVSGTRLIFNGDSVDLNPYAHANVARITLGGN